MGRLLIALSLYLGLGFFFVLNAIALLRGVPIATAILRGFSALALFALLGVLASLATWVRSNPSEEPEE